MKKEPKKLLPLIFLCPPPRGFSPAPHDLQPPARWQPVIPPRPHLPVCLSDGAPVSQSTLCGLARGATCLLVVALAAAIDTECLAH